MWTVHWIDLCGTVGRCFWNEWNSHTTCRPVTFQGRIALSKKQNKGEYGTERSHFSKFKWTSCVPLSVPNGNHCCELKFPLVFQKRQNTAARCAPQSKRLVHRDTKLLPGERYSPGGRRSRCQHEGQHERNRPVSGSRNGMQRDRWKVGGGKNKCYQLCFVCLCVCEFQAINIVEGLLSQDECIQKYLRSSVASLKVMQRKRRKKKFRKKLPRARICFSQFSSNQGECLLSGWNRRQCTEQEGSLRAPLRYNQGQTRHLSLHFVPGSKTGHDWHIWTARRFCGTALQDVGFGIPQGHHWCFVSSSADFEGQSVSGMAAGSWTGSQFEQRPTPGTRFGFGGSRPRSPVWRVQGRHQVDSIWRRCQRLRTQQTDWALHTPVLRQLVLAVFAVFLQSHIHLLSRGRGRQSVARAVEKQRGRFLLAAWSDDTFSVDVWLSQRPAEKSSQSSEPVSAAGQKMSHWTWKELVRPRGQFAGNLASCAGQIPENARNVRRPPGCVWCWKKQQHTNFHVNPLEKKNKLASSVNTPIHNSRFPLFAFASGRKPAKQSQIFVLQDYRCVCCKVILSSFTCWLWSDWKDSKNSHFANIIVETTDQVSVQSRKRCILVKSDRKLFFLSACIWACALCTCGFYRLVFLTRAHFSRNLIGVTKKWLATSRS